MLNLDYQSTVRSVLYCTAHVVYSSPSISNFSVSSPHPRPPCTSNWNYISPAHKNILTFLRLIKQQFLKSRVFVPFFPAPQGGFRRICGVHELYKWTHLHWRTMDRQTTYKHTTHHMDCWASRAHHWPPCNLSYFTQWWFGALNGAPSEISVLDDQTEINSLGNP